MESCMLLSVAWRDDRRSGDVVWGSRVASVSSWVLERCLIMWSTFAWCRSG